MAGLWLRLYTEITRDRKLRRLTPDKRWIWITLLCIAKESPRQGWLLLSEGVPVTVEDLAYEATVDREDVEDALEDFAGLRMIEKVDGVWHLLNWDKRQFVGDNPRERVRKHREKKKAVEAIEHCPESSAACYGVATFDDDNKGVTCNGDVTLQDRYRDKACNVTVTPPETESETETETDTDTDTDTETDTETEREKEKEIKRISCCSSNAPARKKNQRVLEEKTRLSAGSCCASALEKDRPGPNMTERGSEPAGSLEQVLAPLFLRLDKRIPARPDGSAKAAGNRLSGASAVPGNNRLAGTPSVPAGVLPTNPVSTPAVPVKRAAGTPAGTPTGTPTGTETVPGAVPEKGTDTYGGTVSRLDKKIKNTPKKHKADLAGCFAKAFGRELKPYEVNYLNNCRNDLPEELILKALSVALQQDKRSMSEVVRLLTNWQLNDIRTVAEIAPV